VNFCLVEQVGFEAQACFFGHGSERFTTNGKHFVFVAGEKGRRGRGRKVRSEGGGRMYDLIRTSQIILVMLDEARYAGAPVAALVSPPSISISDKIES
jgi:hypothetical protein